ncbi:MAG: bifunctional riboflavin kinase/FAD synthetase [Sphingomonadales bacterium]
MRIFRHYRDVPDDCRGGVITLGNFDGFHRGHQAVLGEAAAIAARREIPLAVLTTEPHPRDFFTPSREPFRLTPFRPKAHCFETFGVDYLYVLPFDRELAAMPAQDFVLDVLLGALGAAEIVVGYDYRFGIKRGGGPEVLRWMGEMEGFGVTVTGPVGENGDIFSSTLIRDHLRSGRPRRAADLLAHWWAIEGRVSEGDRRGRTIGFATANLVPEEYLQPKLGVYAVRATVLDGPHAGCYEGVANFGRRPTFAKFGDDRAVLEVHLFDFSGDIYGAHIKVDFVDFIRPERKFDGLDSLKDQIGKDCADAREILAQPDNAADHFPVIMRTARQT